MEHLFFNMSGTFGEVASAVFAALDLASRKATARMPSVATISRLTPWA